MRLPRRFLTRGYRQYVLAVAAIVAHVFAATGAPIPSPRAFLPSKSSSVPYPCSDHPCGCLTAEQGWAGDCCCFTLEQKLAWADARGIVPPAHVRPAVESRKAQATLKKPKKPCCRGEDEEAGCETKTANHARQTPAAISWVAGVFTQKCRGEKAAGLLQLDPSIPPSLIADRPIAAGPEGFVGVTSPPVAFTSQCPPIPPPRQA